MTRQNITWPSILSLALILSGSVLLSKFHEESSALSPENFVIWAAPSVLGGVGLIYCTVKHKVVTSYAYGILLSLPSFGAAVWHPSTFTRCVTAVIFLIVAITVVLKRQKINTLKNAHG